MNFEVPLWFVAVIIVFSVLVFIDACLHAIHLIPRLGHWWTVRNISKGAWAADKDALERARTEAREAQDRLHEFEQFCARRGLTPTDMNGKPL